MGSLNEPLIGVTTSEMRAAETISLIPESEPRMREMALGLTYLRAIEAAGGMPVVIPPLRVDLVEPYLDRLDGVCLSGGPDLDPRAYGQEPDEHLGPTEPELDRFELALASAADRRRLPILAICRGLQTLNVVRGGTLIQHLPAARPEEDGVAHRQRRPGSEPSHPIEIDPASRLAAVIGKDRLAVNSFHHQAIDRLGGDLVASAWATDGTIEAVEDRGRTYLLGVQWHAELLVARPEEQALFGSFVAAAAAGSRAAGGAAL
ncbi:MAG TPA: gamma-glutamyl-gamma-aminobutyrate hydrolase family protein [Solirubrobacterales bacterium]|nr:gamma-glutamyl-gamma-aminobutyrate hydrolase family protein [Solirubrobacterales bacterium]